MEETDLYSHCTQCPRKCGTDRHTTKGFCGETDQVRTAVACLHFGEEPLLTVFGGSGTIFFTGCTLRCAFCQNYQISQKGMGGVITAEDFTQMCLTLQQKGAENINLVTGSHHIPRIAEFLSHAKSHGLDLPVCWNSSGYETPESLELLKGLVDIYLPDFKTMNPMMSQELFKAQDYPQVAKKAIRWMIQNTPMNIREVEKDGETREKMFSGVIVRHLVMPGRLEDSRQALDWLKIHADGKTCISLMSQYTPVPFQESPEEIEARNKSLGAFQNRLLTKEEDSQIGQMIRDYDFEYLFYQELSDDTSWLPDFNRKQPFSNALATPFWHWKEKFI